jgi:HSP20 family protein
MYLTRRDQAASLPSLQDIQSRMNRLFDGAFDDAWGREGQRTRTWAPPVEIYEADEELIIVLELPGFKKNQINISFENGQLTFSGERNEDSQEGRNYHRNERWSGRFERSFQLPVSADTERISAGLQNGLLRVTIPKKEEAKARQISVEVK